MIKNLLNPKQIEKTQFTGTVITLNPLTAKIFNTDDAISVVPSNNLFGITVGSKIIINKIGNQFVGIGIIGNPLIDSCTLNLTADQTITDTTETKINFNVEQDYTGSNLRYNSTDKCIDVGAGISKVKVDAVAWFNANSIDTYTALYIYLNSTQKTWSIFPDRNDSGVYVYRTTFTTTTLEVEEDDKIYAYAKFSVADASNLIKAYTGANKLIATALEYNLGL